MSLARYQLAVVGAGSAGLASAAFAAELGARVALIERDRLGGDRLRYRLPTAAVIRAARERVDRDRSTDEAAFADLWKRVRELRTADNARNLNALGVDIIYGEARFVAADALEVEGQRLEFHKALIATGARTAIPRIQGLDDVAYRTPETLFDMETRPGRLGVLGAGSRGSEIAQTLAQLGCEVHLLVAGERLLPERDPDAAGIVAGAMRRDGVEIHWNSRSLEIQRRDGDVRLVLPDGRKEIRVDELVVATGPQPNVERLGLEAAGVEYDLEGIEVDRRLRTTNRRIFAAGGVAASTGQDSEVSHSALLADADARIAVRNALRMRRLERRSSSVPRATYTRPEIARVGIDAREAEATRAVETLTVQLADIDRSGLWDAAPSRSAREGFLRLHLKRRTGEVLGGTVVADGATELIAPLVIAVNRRLRLGVFADIPLPHPTRGEIYRRAAFMWLRQVARRRARSPMAAGWANLWLKLTSRF